MAAYSQSVSNADLNALTTHWNDVHDKKAMERVFALLVTEFAAAETAGLASYTVTSGLQRSLEAALDNVCNILRVEFLRDWITFIVTEFDAVETGGLSYTRTTHATEALQEFVDLLNQSISYFPDSTKKISMHAVNALLNTEFGLMAAAS